MKILRFVLIILFTILVSISCSDDGERFVTIVIRGGNEYGSVSKIQIIRSYDGEDIEVLELSSTEKEGRSSKNELFLRVGTKLEIRAFPGNDHEFIGFKGDIETDNRIGILDITGDKKVEILFNYNPNIFNSPDIAGSTYSIDHSSQLRWLANEATNTVDGNIPKKFANITVKLTDDICMDNIAFEGIATSASIASGIEFAGTFDGNGYTIYDLNLKPSSQKVVGFIGKLSDTGSIKNLAIKGNIEAYTSSYVGSVVGYGDTTSFPSVENVYSKVDIFVQPSIGDTCYVGGIAGGNVALSKVYNAGKIYLMSSGANATAAGIIGFGGSISDSYNIGEVSGSGDANVAGIAGVGNDIAKNTIIYAYNIGAVTTKSEMGTPQKGGIFIKDYAIQSTYFLSVAGIINDGIFSVGSSSTEDNPGSVFIPDQFKFMIFFSGFDPNTWVIKDELGMGNGESNLIIKTRPVINGLGEGKW